MNGNLTFTDELSEFTPTSLFGLDQPIIAPFWADVDTRPIASGKAKYGTGTVGGHAAFGVTWDNVGYFDQEVDKTNRFQVIIISRSDLGAGMFDLEFNYDLIQWETGDVSGGDDGLGGDSARVGYSDGLNYAVELPGSAVNGAFLDSNLSTGLVNNSLNSSQLGRYVFGASNFVCSASCTAPTLSDGQFTETGFQFSASGALGSVCTVFASDDAVNWSSIGTVMLPFGSGVFTDTDAGSYQHRYYRANHKDCCSEAIGFIKKTVSNGAVAMIGDPLDNGNGNKVTDLISNPPDGLQMEKYNALTGGYIVDDTFLGWEGDDLNMTLAPGEGAAFVNNSGSDFTLVFIGKLLEGHLSNPVPSGYSIRSSIVPQGGALDTPLGYVPSDNDIIFKYNPSSGGYIEDEYFAGFGWDGDSGGATPSFDVGEAFWIYTSAAKTWDRDYSACCAGIGVANGAFDGSGNFGFSIYGAVGGHCTVYASTDAVTWNSIGSVTLSANPTSFTDADSSSSDHIYYHVKFGTCCSEAIGFIKKTVSNGAVAMIGDPLDNGNGNKVTDLISNPPDGLQMEKYNASTGGYIVDDTFLGWEGDDLNMTLAPGEGAAFVNNSGSDFTLVFIGKLLEGHLSNPVPSGYSIRSSIVPQGGALDTPLGYVPSDNDIIFKYNPSSGGYIEDEYFAGFGWDGDSNGATPSFDVGEAFWIYTSAAKTWVRDYSVCQ